ncbi:hypothetical protein CcrC1_gp458 [Caulobacter phage C1]|nr:hypothetical protein CcrC1_gp458 [Caulobacter phage C1]UTU09765.1 hypothetical protein CcrBL47_gp481 [Caulobacter phage BL47]UTU10319.1 hypothetical protein CcrRB23_gp457 [Caulobacter phage RB23]WGN97872.1 hypothetical protein [Bertelyvirus sp.]
MSKGPPRRFDHDEMIALWRAGHNSIALAARYGVTPSAISRAISHARSKDPTIPGRKRVDLDAVVAAYNAGATEVTIAKDLGYSLAVVYRALAQAGVPLRPRPGSVDVQAATDLRKQGLTIDQIADKLGATRHGVRRALTRAGLTARPSHTHAGPPPRFDHAEAHRLYAAGGHTFASLARRFGVSRQALQDMLVRNYGVTPKRRTFRPLVDKVRKIDPFEARTLYATGQWTYRALAAKYDVTCRAVERAIKGV